MTEDIKIAYFLFLGILLGGGVSTLIWLAAWLDIRDTGNQRRLDVLLEVAPDGEG